MNGQIGEMLLTTEESPVLGHVVHWETDEYYGMYKIPDKTHRGKNIQKVISISRKDELAIPRDWRDFQAIKNELAGPEYEAVELFPAESRLVDPSNRFYLWVAKKFDFGFDHGRNVQDYLMTNEGVNIQRAPIKS